jgi:glutamine amidotransferase
MRRPLVVVVDLGAGNLRSVEKALDAVGAAARVSSSAAELEVADRIVLPGVGSFAEGMRQLSGRGLLEALRFAARRRTPLLGICLGMQLLFEEGEEHGRHSGLGLLPGRVRRLPEELRLPTAPSWARGLELAKVPHTGWNRVLIGRPTPLLAGIDPGAHAYFNHSYYCEAAARDTVARTEHGCLRFAAVVEREGWLYGAQFHPEKSQRVGLQLLRNFVERGARGEAARC